VRRLDASAEETVFIGDSPYDCQAGKAAGVSTASVLWGPFSRETLEPHAPDHWLECPEQVLRLEWAFPGEMGGG
jgi:pyrophosphatase PpaX